MLRWFAIIFLISTFANAQTEKDEKNDDTKKDDTKTESVAIGDDSGHTSVAFDVPVPMTYTPSVKKKIASISLFQIDKCGCPLPFECCKCHSKGMRIKKLAEKRLYNEAKGRAKTDTITHASAQPKGDSLKNEKLSQVQRAKYDSLQKRSIAQVPTKEKQNPDKSEQKSSKPVIVQDKPLGDEFVIKRFLQLDSGKVSFVLPAMPPNRRFMIEIDAIQKPRGIDDVIKILRGKVSGNAKEQYDAIVKRTSYEESHGSLCPDGCRHVFDIEPFDIFSQFYYSSLKRTLDSLEQVESDLKLKKASPPVMTSIKPNFSGEILKELIAFSQECIICSDSIFQQTWLSHDREALANCLINIGLVAESHVSGGLVQINRFYTTASTNGVTLKNRIDNLNYSIMLIGELVEFVRYYTTKRFGLTLPERYVGLYNALTQSLSLLKGNYDLLVAHQKEIADLEKTAKKLANLIELKLSGWYGFRTVVDTRAASTFTYNFDTRAGYSIKADFGFLAYGLRSNYKSLWGVAPFLGFHVNFRPMNTDVPFSTIKCKGILGHLSFHSGALIGSFKKGDDIDGLVKGTAVFTGIGFAFCHALRIHAGTIWFRQKNSNPLVTDMSVSAVPYAGLALDFRLNDIYKSFTSIFQP